MYNCPSTPNPRVLLGRGVGEELSSQVSGLVRAATSMLEISQRNMGLLSGYIGLGLNCTLQIVDYYPFYQKGKYGCADEHK